MKREHYSDEAMEAQLQEFANQLRRATATEMSICIVSGAAEEKAQAAACALAFDGRRYTNNRKSQFDAAFAMLKTAALIIDKHTGGAVEVRLHSPAGEFPITPGGLEKWSETMGK